MESVGLADVALKADPQCKDVSRLYYLPSWNPANGVRPSFEHHLGKPLDVERIFGAALALPFAPYIELAAQASEGTRSPPPREVLKRLRQRFKDPKYVRIIDDLELWVVPTFDGARHEALLKLGEMLARIATAEESSEALLSVARPSLEALANQEPGRDVWGEALRALRGARAKVDQWNRQKDAQRAADRAAWARVVHLASTRGAL